MRDFLTIDLTYSNYHLIFPMIIIWMIIIIGIILLVTNLIKKLKEVKSRSFQFKFFIDNYHKVKLYGSIVLLVVYGITLNIIGFIPATIIFMILSTLLYIGNIRKKSIVISITNSLATTIVIWFTFGYLFDITLP